MIIIKRLEIHLIKKYWIHTKLIVINLDKEKKLIEIKRILIYIWHPPRQDVPPTGAVADFSVLSISPPENC